MEIDCVAAADDALVVGVRDAAEERGDRVEKDAILEVLLGARDDGEFDVDARLHREKVVGWVAALRVGGARVRVLVVGFTDGHRDVGDAGAACPGAACLGRPCPEVDRFHAQDLVGNCLHVERDGAL